MSTWAREPRTARPLRVLSRRNWMHDASATRPIRPPSASISRTRWPLPRPPTAGLHERRPTCSRLNVTQATRRPRRAAIRAASAPAWPAPTTTTSNTLSRLTLPALRSSFRLGHRDGDRRGERLAVGDVAPVGELHREFVGSGRERHLRL